MHRVAHNSDYEYYLQKDPERYLYITLRFINVPKNIREEIVGFYRVCKRSRADRRFPFYRRSFLEI